MTAARLIHLTPRQREIVAGICAGLSYAEIARALERQGSHITVHTVRAHVRHLAMLIHEPEELAPRHRILIYGQHEAWAKELALRLRRVA